MLRINELKQIDLGIQGENLAQVITISISDWLVDNPNGSVTIWHKRNGDSVPTATGATMDREEGMVTWSPTSTDTYSAGEGLAEIRLSENGVIKKTRPVKTYVAPAVTLNGTPTGSSWQDYINAVDGLREAAQTAKEAAEEEKLQAEAWAVGQRDGTDVESTDPAYHNNSKYYAEQAEDAYDDTVQAKTDAVNAVNNAKTTAISQIDTEGNALIGRAETAASHYPFVNPQTRTWYVWDVNGSRWVNTGVSCEGLPGPEGPRGPQGEDGRQGEPGRDGRDAVIIQIGAVEYSFQIDGQGHLIMNYGGSDAPDFEINSQGHLIYTF